MNDQSVTSVEHKAPVVATAGGVAFAPENMGDIVEFAKLMSKAHTAVPKHFRDNPGMCLAVSMQAFRWEMDPFAVARKSYVVNDNLAFEAQMIAAVVNTRAKLKRRPTYTFDGQGDELTCKVSGEFADGVVQTYESPPFGAIKVKNSPLWKSDPKQQLAYFSIRSWARRYCPEVILGIYDRDEVAHFGPDNAKVINPDQPGFIKRLSAAKAKADPSDFEGFDPDHVTKEIAGEPEDAELTTEQEIVEEEEPEEEDERVIAFKAGRQARADGRSLINVPEPYKLDPDQAEAWKDGWREESKLIDGMADVG